MKWFYNLKIAKKLIIAFVLVALISGIVGAIGVININTINKNDTMLYENMTVPITYMSAIAADFQQVRVATRDIILATTAQGIDEQKDNIEQRRADIDQNATEFKKKILSAEMTEAFNNFVGTRKNYVIYLDRLTKLADEGKDEEAKALLKDEGMLEAANAEQESIEKLISLKDDDAKNKAADNNNIADKATNIMLIVICIGVISAIGIGIFISRIISRPILKIVDGAEKIADGDLNVEIELDTKDEIGSLAVAFTKMTYNLNEVMSNISSASEQVAAGSKQVSDSSMALSQGATEQASSVEELSVSLEEISSQTKQNANNANQANILAENTKTDAIEGNTQMKEMLKAMEEINDSSSNISKIIKVIDDIAFQTNILALNAAVEAARAGQYGKGFAVVAEEVRNLAARSANAAKETTAMIEESIKKVEGGTKIADETSKSLNSIVGSIANVANLIQDIANASNEQAAGIAQINQGIVQVSQVIQSNSSTSQESAAASEELAGQAELLKTQVSMFSLRKATRYLPTKVEDRMNPNVSRMLDDMNDKNKKGHYNESVKNAPQKIALSDKEFGKY